MDGQPRAGRPAELRRRRGVEGCSLYRVTSHHWRPPGIERPFLSGLADKDVDALKADKQSKVYEAKAKAGRTGRPRRKRAYRARRRIAGSAPAQKRTVRKRATLSPPGPRSTSRASEPLDTSNSPSWAMLIQISTGGSGACQQRLAMWLSTGPLFGGGAFGGRPCSGGRFLWCPVRPASATNEAEKVPPWNKSSFYI